MLDLGELGGAVGQISLGRQGGHLFGDVLIAIGRDGVIAEELRRPSPTRLLQLAEELSHPAGIVAGVVHDVRTQQVGLLLVLAGVLEEVGANAELDAELCELSADALAQKASQNGKRNLCLHLPGGGAR